MENDFLPLFFAENIYVIPEKETGKAILKAAAPTEAEPAISPQPSMPQPTSQEKRVLEKKGPEIAGCLVALQIQGAIADFTHLPLLFKILEAAGISETEVNFFNLDKSWKPALTDLEKLTAGKKLFFAFVPELPAGIPAFYQGKTLGKALAIFSEPLDLLEADRDKKMSLWKELKRLKGLGL